ncbi:hypothetical protein [Mycolicibacterium austroafricanum]|nr:hypothetical protein [Mycolicibacterium austroafricanum]
MSDVLRDFGTDNLVDAGVRLLTPAIEHVYTVLVRAGVLVIDD